MACMNATGNDMLNDCWKVTLNAVAASSILIALPAANHASLYGGVGTYVLSRVRSSMKLQPELESEMHNPQTNDERWADEVPLGLWGGEHISLEVTERGASVEYDCAHGTIDVKIVLDRRGRFNVPGTHVEERGGPVRENERLNSYPVRFTGRISGKKMGLTVTRSDTKKIIGSFTLVHGQEPLLVKCR